MAGLSFRWPALAAAASLAACDGGASAVPAREAPAAPSARLISAPAPAAAIPPPAGEAKERPLWSSSRRFTSEQNARRNFERNGAAFGARSVADYAAKARAFVDRPPRGSQVLTRANGDRLIYDPAGNVFAVATREGAPRTMFKPDDGAAYWETVKAREAAGGARGRRGEG
ncbi:MAG: hypothetical protein ACOY4K_14505 [Pseudomonadota bacterium]